MIRSVCVWGGGDWKQVEDFQHSFRASKHLNWKYSHWHAYTPHGDIHCTLIPCCYLYSCHSITNIIIYTLCAYSNITVRLSGLKHVFSQYKLFVFPSHCLGLNLLCKWMKTKRLVSKGSLLLKKQFINCHFNVVLWNMVHLTADSFALLTVILAKNKENIKVNLHVCSQTDSTDVKVAGAT